jgi:hypothetical protein
LEKLLENLSHARLSSLQPPKSTCIEMNLGIEKDSKHIRVYSGLTPELTQEWLQFF